MLRQCSKYFCEIGRISMAAKYMLKYWVQGHLLNGRICEFCKGDVFAITNALERYQVEYLSRSCVYRREISLITKSFRCLFVFAGIGSKFSGRREYRLLADVAAAIDEEDVGKFNEVVKEFDGTIPFVSSQLWKDTTVFKHITCCSNHSSIILLNNSIIIYSSALFSCMNIMQDSWKTKLNLRELEEDDLTWIVS